MGESHLLEACDSAEGRWDFFCLEGWELVALSSGYLPIIFRLSCDVFRCWVGGIFLVVGEKEELYVCF